MRTIDEVLKRLEAWREQLEIEESYRFDLYRTISQIAHAIAMVGLLEWFMDEEEVGDK